MRSPWRVLAVAMLSVLAHGMAGAADPGPGSGAVLASRSHAQCPGRLEGPVVRVFASAARWNKVMSAPLAQALGEAVDWDTEQVLVFALPQQRTLGVSVAVAGDAMPLRGRTARLPVAITRPGPDDMAASALSRPCVVVKLSARRWRSLEVRDAANESVLWRGRVRPL